MHNMTVPIGGNLGQNAPASAGSALAGAASQHRQAAADINKSLSETDGASQAGKDPRETFKWFKQHITQIMDAYERTVTSTSTMQAAEMQIVAFGRLLLLKLTEVFPL